MIFVGVISNSYITMHGVKNVIFAIRRVSVYVANKILGFVTELLYVFFHLIICHSLGQLNFSLSVVHFLLLAFNLITSRS
jgi:hypothetical protein